MRTDLIVERSEEGLLTMKVQLYSNRRFPRTGDGTAHSTEVGRFATSERRKPETSPRLRSNFFLLYLKSFQLSPRGQNTKEIKFTSFTFDLHHQVLLVLNFSKYSHKLDLRKDEKKLFAYLSAFHWARGRMINTFRLVEFDYDLVEEREWDGRRLSGATDWGCGVNRKWINSTTSSFFIKVHSRLTFLSFGDFSIDFHEKLCCDNGHAITCQNRQGIDSLNKINVTNWWPRWSDPIRGGKIRKVFRLLRK